MQGKASKMEFPWEIIKFKAEGAYFDIVYLKAIYHISNIELN